MQIKHTRRHREGTRKQVQGIRAQGARASTTRSRRHAVSTKQAGKRTNEGKVRAGRCRVRANRTDMQCTPRARHRTCRCPPPAGFHDCCSEGARETEPLSWSHRVCARTANMQMQTVQAAPSQDSRIARESRAAASDACVKIQCIHSPGIRIRSMAANRATRSDTMCR